MNCQGPAGTFVGKKWPDAGGAYGQRCEMLCWVLTCRDGLFAWEKSEEKTQLVTPIDQLRAPVNRLVWLNVEDDGVGAGLQARRVTEPKNSAKPADSHQ